MGLINTVNCEDEGNDKPQIFRATPIMHLRVMYAIAKAFFTHLNHTTVIDYKTGRVIEGY